MQKHKKEEKSQKRSLVVFSHFFSVDFFTELLVFDEELNEVTQALDEAVAHLLPPPPNQVPPQQGHTQTLPTLTLQF